jgi:hypothetical protein
MQPHENAGLAPGAIEIEKPNSHMPSYRADDVDVALERRAATRFARLELLSK